MWYQSQERCVLSALSARNETGRQGILVRWRRNGRGRGVHEDQGRGVKSSIRSGGKSYPTTTQRTILRILLVHEGVHIDGWGRMSRPVFLGRFVTVALLPWDHSTRAGERALVRGVQDSEGKITPCIFYTSDEKARLRWSRDLHDCFVTAVEKLGGPDKATPKSVKETMEVEGIALHHVKSHLQKFRLGKCNIRDGTNQYIRQSQSMHGLSTITTQQQLQVNNSCVIHDSYHNATFSSATVPPTINSLHQDTLNNTIVLSTTPQSIQASVPHNQYPPYNTLEVVKAQLNALQDSSTNQTQETLSRGTTLSSSVTRDEVDPVDTYIDWDKVNERDIELDLVEIL
ncbi:uncharacterized protein LOC9319798 [Arabidopsis lyrata subsp. lyrata]|uniref:uncharacterized protein LOC9319798 n=1 Tax=Arabidopsis lyrata subsp. lyrata TaxID=81972 RepID=UPI000A29AF16|nr:uncharacterized protein LOC9319798 [Arabidopsis lyrata subsp. lyrata]|eukprot:XP_020887756.1 uncharacterized protein LOC9319798 [Arabidopsis lyrata subsp. lyrata]